MVAFSFTRTALLFAWLAGCRREMLAAIRANAKEIDGVLMYPQNFGEYSGVSGSIVVS